MKDNFEKFNEWRSKVKKRLPELAIKFYTYKINGKYIPYEKEVLLGRVIDAINNPYYSILDSKLDHNGATEQMCAEVMLEILVEELFEYIETELK
jgi:hypothetical protein